MLHKKHNRAVVRKCVGFIGFIFLPHWQMFLISLNIAKYIQGKTSPEYTKKQSVDANVHVQMCVLL